MRAVKKNPIHTDHHTLRMELNPMRFLPDVIWHAEEPQINLLQGYLMSKLVSQHVKVVLGGLGGDELFSDYDIHSFIYPFNKLHGWIPQNIQAAVFSKISFLAYKVQTGLGKMVLNEYRRGLQMVLSTGNIAKFYLILRNDWDFDEAQWCKIYAPQFLN